MLYNYSNVKIYALLTNNAINIYIYILLECHYMFRPDEAIFRLHLCEGPSALRTNQM
jgi:hypothetical protein